MTASWRPPDGFPPGQRRPGTEAVASGKTLDPALLDGRLVGRAPELARIDRVLAAAADGRAGALVLEGASGIGKTALLRAARARAGGFTPVAARGIETEAAWAHGALLELLGPLRRHLAEVPEGQATALASALGWSAAPASGDRFLVAAGTLALLAAAAEHDPVLVLVDDVQWIDAESAGALLFAARRMHSDRVAFVLAQRPGSPHALDGLDVLRVPELSAGAAAELLAPLATGAVAERLTGQLGGNPLALLEVAARLDPAQRSGTAPLPSVLPLGAELTGVFEPAVAALSPDGRTAGIVLAASRTGQANHVATALERCGVAAAAALDEVERDGRGRARGRRPGLPAPAAADGGLVRRDPRRAARRAQRPGRRRPLG